MASRYFGDDAQEKDTAKPGQGAGRGGGRGGKKGRGKKKGGAATGLSTGASTAELESIVFGKELAAAPEGDPDAEDAGGDADADAPKDGGQSEPGSRPLKKRRQDKDSKAAAAAGGQGAAAAAWQDPDDAELQVDLQSRNRLKRFRRTAAEAKISGQEYEQRLREQFVQLHGTAQWVERPTKVADSDSSDAEEDAAIPSSGKAVAAGTGGSLKPAEISITRLKDCEIEPGARKGPAAIQTLNFHPNSELLLAAGLDKRLRLFAVDGDDNPKVSSYFFKNFPITGASFTPTGDQILAVGPRPKICGLDVKTGEPFHVRPFNGQAQSKYFGLAVGPNPADCPGLHSSRMYAVLGDPSVALLCDVATKNVVRTLRMRAPGVAAAFCPENDTLFTADKECNIYEWHLGSGRCKQLISATAKISSLAVRRVSSQSPTSILAVGTTSGYVDMFDLSGPRIPEKPAHSIDNLTTIVTSLQFHTGGELLVAASKFNNNALKLVHTGTATVFRNWPTFKSPLQRVSALDLSRKGGLLSIGNEKGKILLYRLQQYEQGSM